eukprot:2004030-Rhodomonas_salina.3
MCDGAAMRVTLARCGTDTAYGATKTECDGETADGAGTERVRRTEGACGVLQSAPTERTGRAAAGGALRKKAAAAC